MSMSGAALATALFAAPMLAVPTITKASTTFHSGVNLSVAPGGANSSSEPLDVQKSHQCTARRRGSRHRV